MIPSLVFRQPLVPKLVKFSMEQHASVGTASSIMEPHARPALPTALPVPPAQPVLLVLPNTSCQVALAWPALKTVSPALRHLSALSATLVSHSMPQTPAPTVPRQTWQLLLWAVLLSCAQPGAQAARQPLSARDVFRASLSLALPVLFVISLVPLARRPVPPNAPPALQDSTFTPEYACNALILSA